jgi:hypothetical protein
VSGAPALSIVLIVHRMAEQAANTLFTLAPGYQRGVSAEEYEVIVVENPSDDELGEERACASAPNVRYLVGPGGASPSHAITAGIQAARSRRICLMIDGARMVTPRVVRYTLRAQRITDGAVVIVPGYHLGQIQHHTDAHYDEEIERRLLGTVPWRENGYRLFEIAVPSGANPRGVFHPFMESNCLCFSSDAFQALGSAHEAFDLPGGGSVNLFLYRRLVLAPGAELVVLPGEGTFHQYHGGVTTRPDPEREVVLAGHRAQLTQMLGQPFEAPKREPILFGAVTSWAMPLFRTGTEAGIARFARFQRQGGLAWPDDPDPVE